MDSDHLIDDLLIILKGGPRFHQNYTGTSGVLPAPKMLPSECCSR